MSEDLELFKNITSELSKLDSDILNTSICSYEGDLEEMTTEELYEAAQELLWIAKDLATEDDYDLEAIEEAELNFEQLSELL
jgi:hypothetical protein